MTGRIHLRRPTSHTLEESLANTGRVIHFSVDLFHHLKLENALGHEPLEPCVLLLELPKSSYIPGLELSESLAREVYRLLGDPVLFSESATVPESASRRIRTICSSENLAFFIAYSCPEKAITPRISWAENHTAGQLTSSSLTLRNAISLNNCCYYFADRINICHFIGRKLYVKSLFESRKQINLSERVPLLNLVRRCIFSYYERVI